MIKAGTILTCPKCDAPQIKSTKDIKPGDKIGTGEWISLGFDDKNTQMACYKCGELWSRKHPIHGHSQIHSQENGWIETSPKPDAVKKSHIMAPPSGRIIH